MDHHTPQAQAHRPTCHARWVCSAPRAHVIACCRMPCPKLTPGLSPEHFHTSIPSSVPPNLACAQARDPDPSPCMATASEPLSRHTVYSDHRLPSLSATPCDPVSHRHRALSSDPHPATPSLSPRTVHSCAPRTRWHPLSAAWMQDASAFKLSSSNRCPGLIIIRRRRRLAIEQQESLWRGGVRGGQRGASRWRRRECTGGGASAQ